MADFNFSVLQIRFSAIDIRLRFGVPLSGVTALFLTFSSFPSTDLHGQGKESSIYVIPMLLYHKIGPLKSIKHGYHVSLQRSMSSLHTSQGKPQSNCWISVICKLDDIRMY